MDRAPTITLFRNRDNREPLTEGQIIWVATGSTMFHTGIKFKAKVTKVLRTVTKIKSLIDDEGPSNYIRRDGTYSLKRGKTYNALVHEWEGERIVYIILDSVTSWRDRISQ